jgi:hypothetical protein
MEEYIIVPTAWIYKELELCKERIVEYGDAQYYTSKIMLLHKMLEEFKHIK